MVVDYFYCRKFYIFFALVILSLKNPADTYAHGNGEKNGPAKNGKHTPSTEVAVKGLDPFSEYTEVNSYISDKLRKDPLGFNITLRQLQEIEAGLLLKGVIPEGAKVSANDEIVQNLLSKKGLAHSALPVLAQIFRNLGHTSLNNTLLVGEPGVGKSFTIEELTRMLSFGILPMELQKEIGIHIEAEGDQYFKLFPAVRESFIGKTQVINVNSILLSYDNTPSGQAFAKAIDRAKSIMLELFDAAENDFRKNGIRTVFNFEELHGLHEDLFDTLKTLFDKTGFKSLSPDPLVAGKDVGYSIIGLTTFKDRNAMDENVKAQPISRRCNATIIEEPSISEAKSIAREKADNLFYTHGVFIGDDVIDYLIHKRRLLTSPPEAMPGSLLKGLDSLVAWASDRNNLENPKSATVSLSDANRFFLTQVMKLPAEKWIPSPDNPVPFANLADRLSDGFVDHPQSLAIPRISAQLETQVGRGFDRIPFFLILGPSGAGKSTLINRTALELFGHDNLVRHELTFSISGLDEEGVRRLFEGSPDSSTLPPVITAIQKYPSGLIILDEAADAKPGALNYLKVLLDQRGRIQPKTPGSRSYTLGYHAIAVTGQWGQEFFDKLQTDEEIAAAVKKEGPDFAKRLLLQGRANGSGAVDPAIVGRAQRDGDIILVLPPKKAEYPSLVERAVERSLRDVYKTQHNIDIEYDDKFVALVLNINEQIGDRTRYIEGTTERLVDRAIVALRKQHVAVESGSTVKFSADLVKGNIKVTLTNAAGRKTLRTLNPSTLLIRPDCFFGLQNAISTVSI